MDSRAAVTAAIDRGTAALLPDIDVPGGWLLTVDGTPQSYVDTIDPEHLEFEYVRRLAHVVDETGPSGGPLSVVHLGAGALTLPRYVAATRAGSVQTAVDHDQGLMALVREHLPWPPEIEVVVGDARAHLAAAGPVDLVVADLFAGARVPASVTSVEFLRAAAAALSPGGRYVANLADGLPLDFTRGQVAGAQAVFAQVCLIAEPALLRGRRFGNVLIVAGDGPLPVERLARRCAADPFPARVLHGALLQDLVRDARPVPDAAATGSPPPPPGAFGVG